MDNMMPSPWACPRCQGGNVAPSGPGCFGPEVKGKFPWFVQIQSSGTATSLTTDECADCGLPLHVTEDHFDYPYDLLLAANYPFKHLSIWQAMQVNGLYSYNRLSSASCSTQENLGAAAFRDYIQASAQPPVTVGLVLDLGCGPSTASYLAPLRETHELIGLEPLGKTDFEGKRISGVAEYLPLRNNSCAGVVIGTSLDHFLDPFRALSEVSRVLVAGGVLYLWDHVVPKSRSLSGMRGTISKSIPRLAAKSAARIRNYPYSYWYDNAIAIPVHRGLVDPFHSPRSRGRRWRKIRERALTLAGLQRIGGDPSSGFSTYIA